MHAYIPAMYIIVYICSVHGYYNSILRVLASSEQRKATVTLSSEKEKEEVEEEEEGRGEGGVGGKRKILTQKIVRSIIETVDH